MTDRLSSARVAVFGVGGVGGYAVDALVRAGVGTIDIFDNDKVCLTNLNRQIIATHNTIGRYKVDVMADYAKTVDPNTVIIKHNCFYMPENADMYDFSVYDHIIDAIDTVTGKIEIIMRAKSLDIPIISCMGAGNKLDAHSFKVADIYETTVCPLAKTMRHELRKRGITSLNVVYSTEKPVKSAKNPNHPETTHTRNVPGSTAFTPAVAGLIAAGEVLKHLKSCRMV